MSTEIKLWAVVGAPTTSSNHTCLGLYPTKAQADQEAKVVPGAVVVSFIGELDTEMFDVIDQGDADDCKFRLHMVRIMACGQMELEPHASIRRIDGQSTDLT